MRAEKLIDELWARLIDENLGAYCGFLEDLDLYTVSDPKCRLILNWHRSAADDDKELIVSFSDISYQIRCLIC